MAKFLDKFLGKIEPIKIGNLTPLSGEYAYFGEWEKEGIDLALEEINKKGGINGHPVVVVREDDQADPVASVQALNKLILTEKVQAVIGPINSDSVIANAPFAEKNQVVLLTAIAGAFNIPAGGGYIFRIFPTTEQEGKSLVAAAITRGNKTAAIIYINNAYGLELAKTVRRESASGGIEVLVTEGYKKDENDFGGQLTRIKEKNPHMVFLLGYPRDMGLILKQAKELGLLTDFFAPDTFEDPTVRSIAGIAAEGIVYVLPNDTFSAAFMNNFKKKYGKEPNFVDALSYDALNLLALAIKRGGNNGQAIKNELQKIKDYQGASGNITFDESGQAINRPLTLKVVREGIAIPYQQ
jgi:branched-chain amino acid transport system substrate-binding protein